MNSRDLPGVCSPALALQMCETVPSYFVYTGGGNLNLSLHGCMATSTLLTGHHHSFHITINATGIAFWGVLLSLEAGAAKQYPPTHEFTSRQIWARDVASCYSTYLEIKKCQCGSMIVHLSSMCKALGFIPCNTYTCARARTRTHTLMASEEAQLEECLSIIYYKVQVWFSGLHKTRSATVPTLGQWR